MALLPPQAEEAQHGLQDTLQLLQVHHREDPDWLHQCCGSCTALNRKALQREVKTAQHITTTELPSMEDLYTQRCRKKASRRDHNHPSHKLFCLLPQHPVPHLQVQGQLHDLGHKLITVADLVEPYVTLPSYY